MKIEPFLHNIPCGFKGIGFNDRMLRLLASIKTDIPSETAEWADILAVAAKARPAIGEMASGTVLRQMYDHNPSIFQIVRGNHSSDRLIGFNAALPMTDIGLAAILNGNFDPLAPEPAFIARQGQPISAIYVWLTYSPGSFVKTVKSLSDYVAALTPSGCPFFCRGATRRIYDFMISIGYEEACRTYPNAPKGLLAVYPIAQKPAPVISVRLAASMNDLMKVFAVRAATYMAEQECQYDEEYDKNDFCAAHLIGLIDGEPAGCLRIRFFNDFVKFERLAVRREFRQSKLAFRLVREAMRYVGRKGYSQVYGHARLDLVRFWETFGFRKLENAKQLTFSDIDFVEMGGTITPSGLPVKIGDDPYRLIRPENCWDMPGPLERVGAMDRQQRILSRLRRLS